MQPPDDGHASSWAQRSRQFTPPLLNPGLSAPQGVCGPQGCAVGKRFNVYRNNVTHSLKSALAEIFPATRHCCGESRFSHVATLYVRENPPSSRLMFEYGRDFGDFLDNFPPAREQMPWVADLARLERAWLDAWHAADADPLSGEALAVAVPSDLAQLRLTAHPATALLKSPYAIHDLFSAGRARADISAIDPHSPQSVLVTRPKLDVEARLLPAGAATFFDALIEGATLAEAANDAHSGDNAFDLATAIAGLLASGAFIAVPQS